MSIATFTLPFPISVNKAYANGGNRRGRHTTKRTTDWKIEAAKALVAQAVPMIEPPYHVHYQFGRPDNRRRDVFNYEKVLSDLLKKQDVITDDRMIMRGIVEWCPQQEAGTVKVTVRTA